LGGQRPLRGVRIAQRPDGDLVGGASTAVGVDEAQAAGADPDVVELVEHPPGLPALEHAGAGQRDEAEHGVGGEDAPGVVGPPEPAVVGERAERREHARWERVALLLVDPLADVGVEAAEVGLVGAHERQELGDHVAAGKDANERLVLDSQLGVWVREAERGARGGVEDEVARVRGGGIVERAQKGGSWAGELGGDDGRRPRRGRCERRRGGDP